MTDDNKKSVVFEWINDYAEKLGLGIWFGRLLDFHFSCDWLKRSGLVISTVTGTSLEKLSRIS